MPRVRSLPVGLVVGLVVLLLPGAAAAQGCYGGNRSFTYGAPAAPQGYAYSPGPYVTEQQVRLPVDYQPAPYLDAPPVYQYQTPGYGLDVQYQPGYDRSPPPYYQPAPYYAPPVQYAGPQFAPQYQRPVYYERPVYYQPAPVQYVQQYQPAPVTYYQPAPVYYARREPLLSGRVSVNVGGRGPVVCGPYGCR